MNFCYTNFCILKEYYTCMLINFITNVNSKEQFAFSFTYKSWCTTRNTHSYHFYLSLNLVSVTKIWHHIRTSLRLFTALCSKLSCLLCDERYSLYIYIWTQTNFVHYALYSRLVTTKQRGRKEEARQKKKLQL